MGQNFYFFTQKSIFSFSAILRPNENSFFPTSSLKSSSVDELIQEMKTAGITHVFIDDFYIRRLKVMDRNAIDRKAGLMKELLAKAEHIKEMSQLASFETKGNIKSYLYRFNP